MATRPTVAASELFFEWDHEENRKHGLDPHKITEGSTKLAYWVCPEGHKYDARIDHRFIMKSNCPYCSNKRVLIGYNDLASRFPELVKEWDFEKNEKTPQEYPFGSNEKVFWICPDCSRSYKAQIVDRTAKGTRCNSCVSRKKVANRVAKLIEVNGSLRQTHPDLCTEWSEKNANISPDTVTAGSNRYAIWICNTCGYEWRKKISARTHGQGCPACAGKVAFAGHNDLATLRPEIAREWHPTKNGDLTPDKVTAGTDKFAFWLCRTCGYEWRAVISSRSTGIGCPACAGRAVWEGHNDLAALHPEVAKDWHPTKNGDLSPNQVTAGSNKKVWWKCGICGYEWKTTVNSRSSGTGCERCADEKHSSFPEQAIGFYLSMVTPTTSRQKHNKYEIDVFLPEHNVGIEYNGIFYHSTAKAKERDERKLKLFSSMGIRILSVIESDHLEIEGDKFYYDCRKKSRDDLEKAIAWICSQINLRCPDINIKRDEHLIYSRFVRNEKENSLEIKFPEIAEEWYYTYNGTLTPSHVSYGSSKRAWWKCQNKGHVWTAVIHTRRRNGCPICARVYTVFVPGKNDIFSLYPHLEKVWDSEKNVGVDPTNTFAYSRDKYWWKCLECVFSYLASPLEMAENTAVCSNCKNITSEVNHDTDS